MIFRQTSLSKNIVEFGRFLRRNSFPVSIDEEITALRALALLNLNTIDEFHSVLKSALCKSYGELQIFDELFNTYWKELEKAVDSKIKNKNGHGKLKDSSRSLKSWLSKGDHNETEETATYSTIETLSHKDFSTVTAEEKEELTHIIKAFSRRLAANAARRYQKSNKVSLPDIRKTLRLNMRSGGELIRIYYKRPKRIRTRIVILCDVSKSMDLYVNFLLLFMYAFHQVYSKIETFTFGTSLQRVSPAFQHHGFISAVTGLNTHSDTWSGGTRIGECLNTFIKEYGSGLLGKRTIVLIMSDGWDTGDATLVQQAMQHLKEHSKKIIWLNPLAGFASYRPDTAGMKAALPFIDAFLPAHNAASLRNLFLSSANRLF
jgi:uncharacterized protein